MILRCTRKLLEVLGAGRVAEPAPDAGDWYASLLWLDRGKCLLVTHAGTLFSVFEPDVRAARLRDTHRLVTGLIERELRRECLSPGTFGNLRGHGQVTSPLVLVTCSSEFQNDGRLAETALAALAGRDLELAITTAGVDPAALRTSLAPGVHVARFLPHTPLLARAACVVCHGGMGITQKALAAGVPVCAVPFGRDQFEVARRVQVARAGSMLPASRLRPALLRTAVDQAIACKQGAARDQRAPGQVQPHRPRPQEAALGEVELVPAQLHRKQGERHPEHVGQAQHHAAGGRGGQGREGHHRGQDRRAAGRGDAGEHAEGEEARRVAAAGVGGAQEPRQAPHPARQRQGRERQHQRAADVVQRGVEPGDGRGHQADPERDRHQHQRQAGGEGERERQQPPAVVAGGQGQVAGGQEHDAAGREQRHPPGEERRQH